MQRRHILKVLPFFLAALSAGCGGGGDGSATSTNAESASPVFFPTMYTSDGRAFNSCLFEPACSRNPDAPFTVEPRRTNTTLPPEGTTLSGIVRLQVQGLAMKNVELLPAIGYTPRVGVFKVSGDKTNAWLDFDTTALPNGPITLRISGFNVAAGQPGAKERQAMPPRTWNISNPPLRDTTLTASATRAPANNAIVSGTARLEVRGTRLANVELLPAQGYTPSLGQFNISPDRTFAWLDVDTRSFPDGIQNVRISAFNVGAGQPNAREVVAMAPRTWQFRNSATRAFTAQLASAPVHNANVRGIVVLEVRGTGMNNVELLPATGYLPMLGQFTLTNNGTFGYINFDTRTLPNGPLNVRMSVFSTAAGQPGAKEIIAMPARQWVVSN